jgi:hypothetical protein
VSALLTEKAMLWHLIFYLLTSRFSASKVYKLATPLVVRLLKALLCLGYSVHNGTILRLLT